MASEASADPQLIDQQGDSASRPATPRAPTLVSAHPAIRVGALNVSLCLRVAGIALPFAFGLRLLEVTRAAPDISVWRAAVVLLAVGFVSGLLLHAWRAVLFVPAAFVIGLWLGGFLATLHNMVHWPFLGEVDLFFPSLVLLAALPALGAAIGAVLGIAYVARR